MRVGLAGQGRSSPVVVCTMSLTDIHISHSCQLLTKDCNLFLSVEGSLVYRSVFNFPFCMLRKICASNRLLSCLYDANSFRFFMEAEIVVTPV